MAIKYSEILNEVEQTKLTEEENKLVDEVEGFIDKKIKEDFDIPTQINIDLRIPMFKQSIKGVPIYNLKQARKEKMFKELVNRYKNAGWSVEKCIDDSCVGTVDYLVLTPAK